MDSKKPFALARSARTLNSHRWKAALALVALLCVLAPPLTADAAHDPAGPTASFTFTPGSPTTGGTVTLRSTSTPGILAAEILTESWDLNGDGTYGDDTGNQVKTSFGTSGEHTVGLEVTDANGLSDVVTAVITVATQAPEASFSVSPSTPSTLETVTFTSTSSDPDGSIASYAWDLDGDGFDDGTAAEVQHMFLFSGTYTVRLLVTDNEGASAIASKDIQVGNRPPLASFEHSPANPSTGEQITLTSTATDSDGSIASQAWDLDADGSCDDASGAQTTVSFPDPGAHTVRHCVTDNEGASATDSAEITVANRPPTASFTSSPDAPRTGEQITFTSNSSDPDDGIDSYAWDLDGDNQFDDGSGATVQRSYATPGSRNVSLKVTDVGGLSHIATQTIVVANREPTATFGQSPASPKSGDEVTFTSTSTDADGSIVSYAWDLNNDGAFDDGSGTIAHRTFQLPGVYTIRLQVVDNDGASSIGERTVTIANRLPVASFDYSPASPLTLEPVTFTSTSTDPEGLTLTTEWDFGADGTYDDAGASTQRTFMVPGTYNVRIRVTDSSGDTATAVRSVTVQNRPPQASFGIAPAEPTTDGPVNFTSTSTDPEGQPLTTTWDLDGDTQFDDGTGATAARHFTIPGTYTVSVKVVDASGAPATASQTVTIPNRAPTASVDHEPKSPQTREAITFTATATDPEGRVKSRAWDSDNDGQFDDGTGATLTRAFNKPGAYTVRFRIEDLDGASAIAEDVVAVNNQPPAASFVVVPESPTAGVQATLVSTALDPDTPLERWQWDLNGDGVYGDAEGAKVGHIFPTAGSYSVGLRVFDSEAVDSVVVQTVVVKVPPVPAPAPQLTPTAYQLLSPFPVVRLAGRIGKAGTRLRLFSIEAPPGSLVVVDCRGRGCPFRRSARSAVARGDGKARTSASLRMRKLESRLLRKGVRIRVYITKPGTIGKYVLFKFRKMRPPARTDRCLMPAAPSKPVECPS